MGGVGLALNFSGAGPLCRARLFAQYRTALFTVSLHELST